MTGAIQFRPLRFEMLLHGEQTGFGMPQDSCRFQWAKRPCERIPKVSTKKVASDAKHFEKKESRHGWPLARQLASARVQLAFTILQQST